VSEQTFEDRVAALEKHIVSPTRYPAEWWLEEARHALALGDESDAKHCLTMAKIEHSLGNLEDELDESEEEDDDA
jgi:hypothetical protein